MQVLPHKPLNLVVATLVLVFSVGTYAQEDTWLNSVLASPPTRQIVGTYKNGQPLELVCFQDADRKSIRYKTQLCWLELPQNGIRMSVNEVRRADRTIPTYSHITPTDDLVAVNGGYFGLNRDNRFMPLGLVVSNRKQTSRLASWASGAVVHQSRAGDQVHVTPIGSFLANSESLSAVQTKPLLVNDGAIVVRSRNDAPFNETAIGVTSESRLLIIGAFSPDGNAISLRSFARFARLPRNLNGPAAATAVALDGGPGAQLYFPQRAVHFGYEGTNYIPNILSFGEMGNGKADH